MKKIYSMVIIIFLVITSCNSHYFGELNGETQSRLIFQYNRWLVCYNASGDWYQIDSVDSIIGIDDILFGNFDGDSKTDIFVTTCNTWYIKYNGDGSWFPIEESSATVDRMKLGYFNSDGISDVFYIANDFD